MITLTAKINLLSGDNKALSLGLNNLSKNNISSDLGSVIGVKTQSRNPFLLGVSKFGEKATFSSGENYFIGNQVCNENGRFDYIQTIKIENEEPIRLPFRYGGVRNGKPIATTNIEFNASWWRFNAEDLIVKSFTIKNIEVVRNGEIVSSLSGQNSYNCYSHAESLEIIDNNVRFLLVSEIVPEIGEPLWDMETDNVTKVLVSADVVVKYKAYEIIIQNKENKNISSLSIQFDTVNNRHPKTIKIDGQEYIDDDPVFTIVNLTPAPVHTIYIDNWNTPLFPIVITGIYAEIAIEIDRRNIISLERTIFDRSDLKLPSWGIISNTGNIEFNDTDGEIRDYAEQLLLQSGLKCEIKLNNTLVDGASQTIGVFETDEWDYDNDNRVVSVSLKDDLEEWQDINVEGFSYNPIMTDIGYEEKILRRFYNYLWEITSNRVYGGIKGKGNYNMLAFEELDYETRQHIVDIYIQYPLLASGSLWQQWTKLCQVGQLHIYKNNDGVIVCRYNGGN